ncbi:ABC-2 type transport system ATP-binding protein [Paenibacillus sophorae]|uniref:ABC-2 type transport system ATP-binding protein n=1 Tax=Paenibacillus sophorae TaxID=1333845 RepID=A0A1H8U3K2_9BACL|nr:ATP-binding cassette domain-containing protein [Paenibacillus sophorae]QWU17928.1 ATP-binding cassette domain-containing protein [Paenibacillus sophorae]SEO97646.1 ABC-2 type transport system ATP-binding protein [Paenibacillus sophorae]
MDIIVADHLVRQFDSKKKPTGSFKLLKAVFSLKKESKNVVDNVSFTVRKGEIVGYIGPNGAGKSTTIKMLSGVLVPTSGTVLVKGLEPYKNRKQHAGHIGVVFGQRTQLWWDLPLIESFKLLGKIYDVPKERFQRNLEMFTDILDMSSFLSTPVRQLSLGQRMRGDIAAALLHEPEILFLDEPTIGLDIMAKEKIQSFLQKINKEKEITIILTTHNMDDIEKLCHRVIFIDKGQILFDGSAEVMTAEFGGFRYLVVDAPNWDEAAWNGPPVERREDNQLFFRIEDDKQVASMIKQLTDLLDIHNLTVQEPKIDDVIKQLYQRIDH